MIALLTMKEKNQLKLTYNQIDSKICLETYDEGFFNQSIDINLRSNGTCDREAI